MHFAGVCTPDYAVRIAVIWGCPAMGVFGKHVLSSLSN